MVRNEEMYKRLIQTVIDHIPSYFSKFTLNEQKLLIEFLDVLQHYEEADFARDTLLTRFKEYRNSLKEHPQLLRFPFLWYGHDFVNMALRLLSVSDFHSIHFYSYLDKHLRGGSDKIGFFPFVRSELNLTDQHWEILQINANKLRFALNNDQFKDLIDVHRLVFREGVYSLDQRIVINLIKKSFNKSKLYKEISNFFTLLDTKWFIHVHFPAFGLVQHFFQIELDTIDDFDNVFSLQNFDNSVLGISDVYSVNKSDQNSFLGLLISPYPLKDKIRKHFIRYEQEGLISSYRLAEITNSQGISSFSNYKPNEGWRNLTKSEWNQILKYIRRGEHQKEIEIFATPLFNEEWTYKMHQKPSEVIAFICRCPYEVSFKQLPWNTKKDPDSIVFSQNDKGLLKQLHKNNVLHTTLLSYTLYNEYSLTPYCIKAPMMDFNVLANFLSIFPYSHVFISGSNYYIWTQLPKRYGEQIENDLKWEVDPIQRKIPIKNLHLNWYDIERQEWFPPKLYDNL
ncbi:MAG: hypothetical protein ACXACU_03145 [Candidatus Hodarchaeales archaeon]